MIQELESFLNQHIPKGHFDVARYKISMKRGVLKKTTYLKNRKSHDIYFYLKNASIFSVHQTLELKEEIRMYGFSEYWDVHINGQFIVSELADENDAEYLVSLLGKISQKVEGTIQENEHVKILFRFYSDLFEEEMVETMWAIVADQHKGLYVLDNIPFYAPLAASGDTVFAEFDEKEEMLTYRETVKDSGNSTIQVVLADKSADIDAVRNVFHALGGITEKANAGYFSMEIPSTIDYTEIRRKLKEMEENEIIGYAESCLGEGHRY